MFAAIRLGLTILICVLTAVLAVLAALGLAPTLMLLVAWWGLGGATLCVALLWLFGGRKGSTKKIPRAIEGMASMLACFALQTSVVFTLWPMRLVFPHFEKQADALAERMAVGGNVLAGTWFGPYRIARTEVNKHGVICLWVTNDRNGTSGFVRAGRVGPQAFNPWFQTQLTPHWQWFEQD